jgi:hypothetical protein
VYYRPVFFKRKGSFVKVRREIQSNFCMNVPPLLISDAAKQEGEANSRQVIFLLGRVQGVDPLPSESGA